MKNPNLIATIRAFETLVIASLAASVMLVAPQIATALQSKAAFETFDWRGVFVSILIGMLAGLWNYVTAYFTAQAKNTVAVNDALQTVLSFTPTVPFASTIAPEPVLTPVSVATPPQDSSTLPPPQAAVAQVVATVETAAAAPVPQVPAPAPPAAPIPQAAAPAIAPTIQVAPATVPLSVVPNGGPTNG